MHIDAGAVLFDSDGVLVDSHDLVEAAWRRLAGEFDLQIEALLGELAGVRSVDTLGRHLEPGRVGAAVARLEAIEVGLAAQTQVKPGARQLIGRLLGTPWAIVTSASRRLAEARWSGAGLTVPGVTVTAEDVEEGKPSPEPFLTAAELLGVPPGRCVVFEDSPSGGLAARSAGAIPVAVGSQAWPFAPAARIPSLASVTVVVPSTGGVELTLANGRRPPG